VIAEVQQRYREFLENLIGAISPYMSISEIEGSVDPQMYQIFKWLSTLNVPPTAGLVAIGRRTTFDNARPSYLRAVCRAVLQDHGTMADLDRLEASYSTLHEDFEKAQVLVSLKRLEVGRRNAFYGRVARSPRRNGRSS